MRSIFPILFLLLFISCKSRSSEDAYQGKLDEVIVGEMNFERDTESGYLSFQEPVTHEGKELIYTKWNEIISFFDPKTGRKIRTFRIPKEGPQGIKGGAEIAKVFDNGLIAVTNSIGMTNYYQNEKLVYSFKRDIESYEPKGYLYFPDNRNALHQISENQFEITFNPYNFMGFREGKDGLDLDFVSWVGSYDQEGNLLCKSNFKAPYDESFKNSSLGGKLLRLVDQEKSWLMFPYSDSLYQIKNCEIINRLKLDSKTLIQYFPEKIEGNSRSARWIRPENGALNTHLLYDINSNNYVRMIHLKEKRSQPEVTDERKRLLMDEVTYLLLVYDPDWKLKAEFEITYPSGTRFENLFSTSQGLFINKPEQKSEDEYEFYKIDLSQFRN
ncbi:hypothetical protein [Algoriphagus confluentis]|uniref:DUF4221 domain-containing protein n=1 Tax=Algoriphagus confluentis TaxID=1697556 RepID=A0ABQ6PR07_9BACT|nr:hypothetical protein Aconfl_30380 [Algoriphagus confluentis]